MRSRVVLSVLFVLFVVSVLFSTRDARLRFAQAAMPPSKKSLFDTLVGTLVETSAGGSAPPCGSIILTHREAEFHNLPPCGSKIRNKPGAAVCQIEKTP